MEVRNQSRLIRACRWSVRTRGAMEGPLLDWSSLRNRLEVRESSMMSAKRRCRLGETQCLQTLLQLRRLMMSSRWKWSKMVSRSSEGRTGLTMGEGRRTPESLTHGILMQLGHIGGSDRPMSTEHSKNTPRRVSLQGKWQGHVPSPNGSSSVIGRITGRHWAGPRHL